MIQKHDPVGSASVSSLSMLEMIPSFLLLGGLMLLLDTTKVARTPTSKVCCYHHELIHTNHQATHSHDMLMAGTHSVEWLGLGSRQMLSGKRCSFQVP